MPKSVYLPEVAPRKRAKAGPFILNTDDRQPILGMTDEVVNLLRHFIGN